VSSPRVPQSVLRYVHSHFHSQFATHCDLVLPLSIYSVLVLPAGHPVAAYLFFLIFPSLISFPLPSLQKAIPTQDVTNPVSLPSLYCTHDIALLTESLTRSVQLIFQLSPAPHFKNFRVFTIYFLIKLFTNLSVKRVLYALPICPLLAVSY